MAIAWNLFIKWFCIYLLINKYANSAYPGNLAFKMSCLLAEYLITLYAS